MKNYNYPIYRKSEYHWYKIYSEESAVQVFNGYCTNINIVHSTLGLTRTETSNEREFLDVYNEVKDKLNKIINE